MSADDAHFSSMNGTVSGTRAKVFVTPLVVGAPQHRLSPGHLPTSAISKPPSAQRYPGKPHFQSEILVFYFLVMLKGTKRLSFLTTIVKIKRNTGHSSETFQKVTMNVVRVALNRYQKKKAFC